MKSQEGFLSLIGLLLSMAIILILCFIALTYFKESPVDDETEKILSEQNIDSSNPQATLNAARKKIQDINTKVLNREKEMERW